MVVVVEVEGNERTVKECKNAQTSTGQQICSQRVTVNVQEHAGPNTNILYMHTSLPLSPPLLRFPFVIQCLPINNSLKDALQKRVSRHSLFKQFAVVQGQTTFEYNSLVCFVLSCVVTLVSLPLLPFPFLLKRASCLLLFPQ